MIEGLPQWRCHKVVGAFKIREITTSPHDGKYLVYPEHSQAATVPVVEVAREVFRARVRFPQEYIGGFLVQYNDGYLSWSPSKAFEDGYTRIE